MPLASQPLARLARADSSLEGLSVGDAFGERFFGPPEQVLPRLAQRALSPAPWGWTDDTAMGAGVRAVLAARGHIDQELLAKTFAKNFIADRMRGYGAKAQEALEAIARGHAFSVAARLSYREGSKGNGAAMRAGPVGAYFADDLEQAAAQAAASAEVTHAHPEGISGAIAVALAAAWACRSRAGASLFEVVLPALPVGEVRRRCEEAARCPASMPPVEAAAALGSGREVLAEDTVPFCLWCAAAFSDSYEEALWATVSGLGDRDTTCAIVGSIVGLRAPVPQAWLAAREALPR
jgi:ADP-ribosylglycohydrolase